MAEIETDAPKAASKLPPWLTKKIAGQPTYVWVGGLAGGVILGLYLRSRRNNTAGTSSNDGELEEVEDIEPEGYADSGYGGADYAGSAQEWNVPAGSKVTTDPETGAVLIEVPNPNSIAAEDTSPAVDTGGGVPSAPARTPAPKSKGSGHTAVGTVAPIRKGVDIAGKWFDGAISKAVVGRGSNSNGSYTTHAVGYPNGTTKKWNHYTSGKNAGKWVGPFA